MKKLTLVLLSIATGLLLGRYYSLVTRKMLLEYIITACLSLEFINDGHGNLVSVKK